jgi:hypothetical protein
MIIQKYKWLDLKTANKLLARAPLSTWSDGIAPPHLFPSVLKGTTGGRPSSDGKMRYTASQMRKFATARCPESPLKPTKPCIPRTSPSPSHLSLSS